MPVDPAVRLMSLVEVRPDHPDYDARRPAARQAGPVYPAR